MNKQKEVDNNGQTLKAGDKNYRAFVGPPDKYDIVSAMQFNLLTLMGLREYHKLLDIGCGSLRAGRLFIPYLLAENYYGIEPERWLVEDGITHEIGQNLIKIKNPHFLHSSNFEIINFNTKFDYIVAQSIFSHTSLKQIEKCLEEVSKCIEDEGVFLATFYVGNEDYNGTEWVYPGCVQFCEKTMIKLAKTIGLDFKIIDWPHPNGQTWGVFCRSSTLQKIKDPTYLYCKIDHKRLLVDNFIENPDGTGTSDTVRIIGNRVYVNGWARNPFIGEPAEDVIIVANDQQVVASAKVFIERQDVSNHFKDNKMLYSGWEATFNKEILQPGQHTIKAYIYLKENNNAIRLANELHIRI